MTGFVLGHFMDGIMDGIVAQLFGQGSDFLLASASTLFSSSPHLQVLLGAVGDYFTQQFCEFGCRN